MFPNNPKQWADNEMMVYVASKAYEWKWPSKMHCYKDVQYTRMKDMTVLLLVFFQRLLRDKKGPWPLMAALSFPIAISSMLLYVLGSFYWNPKIGLLVATFYIISIWFWELSLFGGHLNVATMFLLLGALFGIKMINDPNSFWIILSGISLGLMLFSSAASWRYLPLFFGSLVYVIYYNTLSISFYDFLEKLSQNYIPIIHLWIFGLLFILNMLTHVFAKNIITFLFRTKFSPFSKLLKNRDNNSLDHYFEKRLYKIKEYPKFVLYFYTFLAAIIFLIGIKVFILIGLGFGFAFLVLTLPDIPQSLRYYFSYIYMSYVTKGTGFGGGTIKEFAKKGITVSGKFRGGGLKWLPKIYFRMAPWHTAIYLIFIATLSIKLFYWPAEQIWVTISLILLSLSPTLWGELTGSVQASRAYSSGVIGYLLFIGYGSYIIAPKFDFFWPLVITYIIVAFIWNLYYFITDIYPSRMTITNLLQSLKKLCIKEFYTPKIIYNKKLIYSIEPGFLKEYKVNFINLLSEAKNGWIVIPPTSSISLSAPESEESLGSEGYRDDPILNYLLDSKSIEKIAAYKFKMLGSSPFWNQEGDVSTYRDLILGEIDENERFKSHAWLVHANKLNIPT